MSFRKLSTEKTFILVLIFNVHTYFLRFMFIGYCEDLAKNKSISKTKTTVYVWIFGLVRIPGQRQTVITLSKKLCLYTIVSKEQVQLWFYKLESKLKQICIDQSHRASHKRLTTVINWRKNMHKAFGLEFFPNIKHYNC